MKFVKPALVAVALLAAPHAAIAGGAGAAIDTPQVVQPVAKRNNLAPIILGVIVAGGAAVALSSR